MRVTAVRLHGANRIAWYDGRATAAQNFEEQTGLARMVEPGRLTALGAEPVGVSPYGLGA